MSLLDIRNFQKNVLWRWRRIPTLPVRLHPDWNFQSCPITTLCLQDSRLSVSDFIPHSRLCSYLQDSISSEEDKCYLDSRLSEVFRSDHRSESDTPSHSLQVLVPLVINDKVNDACSSLQVVKPCFSSSISSCKGILSQSFVSPDLPLLEPNSFVTLHNLVHAMGRPNFLGAR